MEEKLKHLEFIQDVITRMATNSFLIKGWCVILVAALTALSAKDADFKFVLLAYIPVLVFWFLDAYYLLQERLFRRLYDIVREKDTADFSMSTKDFKDKESYWDVLWSKTVWPIYVSVIVVLIILIGFYQLSK